MSGVDIYLLGVLIVFVVVFIIMALLNELSPAGYAGIGACLWPICAIGIIGFLVWTLLDKVEDVAAKAIRRFVYGRKDNE